MPRLSVSLMTAGPAERAAAILRLLRPVADELYVAVDERAGAALAGALATVADRVVLYPYAEPVDRPLPWLHAEAAGEWVLTVDDDEIPSAGLLRALPELLAARDVTHYWLPRRWLYPGPGRYLDEQPWRPDYQLRLVLNDQRLLRFPDETHVPIEVLGPGRYLELPLYHADVLLGPAERRLEKARRYERLRPGRRVVGGPLNHVFYLPERRPGVRTAAVPDEDLPLIESVLEAPPVGGSAGWSGPAADRERIDRLWTGRSLEATAYRARLEALEQPHSLRAGEQRTLDVRVTNLGEGLWPWGDSGRPEIRLAYRWRDTAGVLVVPDGLRTPLPADLPPAATTVVPVHVVAPPEPGRYRLELDLLHEHVRWFGASVELEVDVQAGRRLALAGTPEAVERARARLTEERPELEPVALAHPDGRVALRSCDALLLTGARPPGRRALLRLGALVLAARRLGLPVVAEHDAVPPWVPGVRVVPRGSSDLPL